MEELERFHSIMIMIERTKREAAAKRRKEKEEYQERKRVQHEQRRRDEEQRRRQEDDEKKRLEEKRRKEEERARYFEELRQEHCKQEGARERRRRQVLCRATEDTRLAETFAAYECQWTDLKASAQAPISFAKFPWPSLLLVQSPADITLENVREFVFHPARPNIQGKSAKDRLKVEILRWHPDKFNATVVKNLPQSERELVAEAASLVARWMNRLLTE